MQARGDFPDRAADDVLFASNVQRQVVPRGLDAIDVGSADEIHAARRFDHNPLEVTTCPDGGHEVEQASGRGFGIAARQRTNSDQGVMQPLPVERFQQVIRCVDVERLKRVLVVCGHEDHCGTGRWREGVEDIEPVHPRHLDIQEHNVRPRASDRPRPPPPRRRLRRRPRRPPRRWSRVRSRRRASGSSSTINARRLLMCGLACHATPRRLRRAGA